jgi:hypothetical protein
MLFELLLGSIEFLVSEFLVFFVLDNNTLENCQHKDFVELMYDWSCCHTAPTCAKRIVSL